MGYEAILHAAAIAAGSIVIAGAAGAVCASLRRVSASFRHLVLVGMFVSLIGLPVMSLLVPAWNLPVMPAGEPAPTAAPAVDGRMPEGADRAPRPADGEGVADQAAVSGEEAGRAAPAEAPTRRRSAASLAAAFVGRHLSPIALAVWAIGALVVLVVQLVRWAGAGFIAEMATAVDDGEMLAVAERIRWEMGIKRRVGLLGSEMAAVSMVWGIRRPYIVLPACARSWSAGKLEAVLRHELAHVKRWDNLLQIVAVVACGLYWFNPFVWTAMKRLHFEREVACDNAVLNAGSVASAYAKHLMEISVSLSGPKSRRIIPAVMAHSSDVKRRLMSVLSTGVSRRPAGAAAAAVCVGLVLLLALPVSSLRLGPRSAEAAGADMAGGAALSRTGGETDGGTMRITGTIQLASSAERRYFRSGKISMKGSYGATGDGVFIEDADLEDKKSRIRVQAENVELDPSAELGCRFEKEGCLCVTRREGRRDLEYKVSQRRKGGDYLLEATFAIDGREIEFDDARREEFRAIAAELYDILGIDDDPEDERSGSRRGEITVRADELLSEDDRSEAVIVTEGGRRAGGPSITIGDGMLYRGSESVEIEGTLLADGWFFEGSMDGTGPRVVIVDGALRNRNAGVEIEGRNLVLDPASEKGWRFNEDEGSISMRSYGGDAKIEYDCRREKKGRKLVTTDRCYRDGERVESDEDFGRELKRILDSAYHWITDGDLYQLEPPAPPASIAGAESPAPPLPPERARTEALLHYHRARRVAEAAERRHARREYEARYLDEEELHTEGLSEVLEELGAAFEHTKDRYEDRLDSRRAERAITEAYEAREDRIERLEARVMSRIRENPETPVAVEGCRDIIIEYEKVAISALESVDDAESRAELREALVDFFDDLIGEVDEIIVEIEDGRWGEGHAELRDSQIEICRGVREFLRASRDRIGERR